MKRIFVAISIILCLCMFSSCVPDSTEEKMSMVEFGVVDSTGNKSSFYSLELKTKNDVVVYDSDLISLKEKVAIEVKPGVYDIVIKTYDADKILIQVDTCSQLINIGTRTLSIEIEEKAIMPSANIVNVELNKGYESIKDAISDVPSDGKEYTLRLQKDIETESFSIDEAKKIVLDLDGFDILLKDAILEPEEGFKGSISISGESQVTLVGEGLVRANYEDGEKLPSYMEAGTNNRNYLILVSGGARLSIVRNIVLGGLLEDHPSSRIIGVLSDSSLYVNNGIIRAFSANGGSAIYNAGYVEVNGGTILGSNFAIGSDYGDLVINGGCMFSVATNKFPNSYYAYCVRAQKDLTMTGGSVYGIQGAIAKTAGEGKFSGDIHAETTVDIFDKMAEHVDLDTVEAYKAFYRINSKKDEPVVSKGELCYALYCAGEAGKVEPVNIYGGTYISGAQVALSVGNSYDGGIGAFAGVTVYDGKFISPDGMASVSVSTNGDYGSGNLRAFGGEYSSNTTIDKFVVDGYSLSSEKNQEGFYEILKNE